MRHSRRSRFGRILEDCRRQSAPRRGGFRCILTRNAPLFFRNSALAPVSPSAPASPPASLLWLRISRRYSCTLSRLLYLARNRHRRFQRFYIRFERQARLLGRNHGRRQGKLARRRARCFHRKLSGNPAQTHRRFLRLHFPIRAAKSFCRRRIPFRGVRVLSRRFEILRQFERHHRVPRLLIKIRKLSRRIFAGARASDSGGNLFPVGHLLLALYQRNASAASNLRTPGATATFSFRKVFTH